MRFTLFDFIFRLIAGWTRFYAVEAPERPTSTDLRGQLLEAGDKLRELRAKPEDARSDKYADELRTTTRQVEALDAEFSSARAAEAHELQQAAWDAAVRQLADPEGRGPKGANDDHRQVPRTLAERVTGSDEYRAWVDGGGKGPMPHVELRGSFREGEFRALINSDVDQSEGNAGLLMPAGQPIPPNPRQLRLVMRDLIPSTETTLASVPYVREYTPATAAPSMSTRRRPNPACPPCR